MQIRCPHCQNPLEVLDDSSLTDINCPSCDCRFNLLADDTIIYRPGENPAMSDRADEHPTIGHFELQEKLGTGAFGTVWKARDTKLDRSVAVKIPRKEQLSSSEIEKFIREARAAAQLKHPNIVSVHEVGRENGQVYIVSDLVDGLDLSDWLTDQTLSSREAAELCAKVADALEHAHRAGVIHRDLKPANVMIDAAGEPHIMDFGLAKRETGEITMTTDGQVMGTPAYMSPEQAKGESHDADARSDVYSLGVMLFELLTKERPFRGNMRMLLHQVIHEEPPSPRKLNATIPRDLETICLKCLEKEPAKRYESATALEGDLGRYLAGKPITSRPISQTERTWRWCRRNSIVASLSLAVVLVLATGTTISTILGVQASRSATKAGRLLSRNEILLKQTGDALISEKAAHDRTALELYSNRISATFREWETDNVAVAAETLTTCEPSLRGWEYGYVNALVSGSGTIIQTHIGPVTGVALSPDNERIISVGWDKRLQIFDAQNFEILVSGELGQHRGSVNSVAASPDGSLIATASLGASGSFSESTFDHQPPGDIRVWNARSGRLLSVLKGHEASVESVTFTPDGKQLVSGGYDKTVRIWNIMDRTLVATLKGHTGPVSCVGVSPDGKRIASGSADTMLRGDIVSRDSSGKIQEPDTRVILWDLKTAQQLGTLEGHTSDIRCLAFGPHGKRLVSGGNDRTIRLWEISTGKELKRFTGHRSLVTCVAFLAGGERIVSGSNDGLVKTWDITEGRELHSFRGHLGEVSCVAVSSDGARIVSGDGSHGASGEIRIWNVETESRAPVLSGHTSAVTCVAYSPLGQQLVTGSVDKTVKLWDSVQQTELHTFRGHTGVVLSVAVSPDGKTIASSSGDKTIRLWSVDGNDVDTLRVDTEGVTCVAFSRDGKQVVGGSLKTIRVWDVTTGDLIQSLNGHTGVIMSLAVSPDGHRIVSGSVNAEHSTGPGEVILWDRSQGTLIHRLEGHANHVLGEAFSPDGTKVASAAGTVRIWDVATGVELLKLEKSVSPAAKVVFSRDGRRLFGGCADGTIKIWDVSSGVPVFTLRGHSGPVTSIAISADGQQIASGSVDGAVRLWNASRRSVRFDRTESARPTAESGGNQVRRQKVTTPEKQSAKTPDAAEVKKHMTPAQLALGDPVVNSIGMLLVPIPAGQFQMGSPETDSNAHDIEKPQHLVKITKPFYLSVHEVTQQQYEKVMGTRPWQEHEQLVSERPDSPATWVNHDDAVEFCRKLSEQEGVEYRLPTEAKWEYACRAGTTTVYGFGDDASQLGRFAWYRKNARDIGEGYAHRAGQKLPNPWGLYDMHGNVWEWCQDWIAPYGNEKDISDTTGPVREKTRVLRGGSFGDRSSLVRSAVRGRKPPSNRILTIGFRPSRTYSLSP